MSELGDFFKVKRTKDFSLTHGSPLNSAFDQNFPQGTLSTS